MRHAEPVRFCGRGSRRIPYGGRRGDRDVLDTPAPVGSGKPRVGSPARTARKQDTHTQLRQDAAHRQHRAAQEPGRGRPNGRDLAGSARTGGDGPDPVRIVDGRGVGAGRVWMSGGMATSLLARAGPGATQRPGGDLGETEMDEGLRTKGAWWMPWRWRPRKDVATRRNALGRRWQPVIQGSPNGATRPAHGRAPRSNPGRGPGELKHLSTPRKREDSLSSGERTGRSPNSVGGTACRRCLRGVGRASGRGRQSPRLASMTQPKTAGTGHRRG
jgi:hypothetical protein